MFLRYALVLVPVSVMINCSHSAPNPLDVVSIDVVYSVADPAPADPRKLFPGSIQKSLVVSEADGCRALISRLAITRRSPMVCSCKLANSVTVRRRDGSSERWHFCHSPSTIGVRDETWYVTPSLYEGLKAHVGRVEGGRVALICQNEDLR